MTNGMEQEAWSSMLDSIEELGDGTTVLSGGTALLWIGKSFSSVES